MRHKGMADTGAQGALFDADAARPEGFLYRRDVITRDEETRLVEAFATLPFKPFEFHGYLGNRRIVSFGWRYDYTARGLRASDPVPSFLLPLRERAAAFAGIPAGDLKQVLVTEYAPGAGIGWHRDKPMFADVVAFSFLSSCVLRFRRRSGAGWERHNETVETRSAYLLRGPSREVWEHSIPPLDAMRYSITFRNFR